MTDLARLHRLASQCADRLRGLAVVAHALEDGNGSERDVIAYRQSALGALTSLVFALRGAEDLPTDLALTSQVLLDDAETSAPLLSAGVCGVEKVERIASVAALLAQAIQWEREEAAESPLPAAKAC